MLLPRLSGNPFDVDVLLQILTDPASLERAASGAITGLITTSCGSDFFPEARWRDFPAVVLTWWLESVNELLAHGETTLRFMDGPFSLRLRRKGDWLDVAFITVLSAGEWEVGSAEVSTTAFLNSLHDAAESILRSCEERGWARDVTDLSAALHQTPN